MKIKNTHSFLLLVLLILTWIVVIFLFYTSRSGKKPPDINEKELKPISLVEHPFDIKDKLPYNLDKQKSFPKPELDIQFEMEEGMIYSKQLRAMQIVNNGMFLTDLKPSFAKNPVSFIRPDITSAVAAQAVLFASDIFSIVKKPLTWDGNDLLKFGAVGLGTFVFTQLDEKAETHFRKNRNVSNTTLFEGAEYLGRNTTLFYSALGFNALGFISGEPELNIIGLELFESYLIAETLSNIFKNSFGRSRPYADKGAFTYNPFDPLDSSERSLPSGHTTLAFTFSTVLAAHVKNPYYKALIFAPALLTGAQRLYSGNHWLSDVFLGAALGYAVGSAVTSLHGYDSSNKVLVSFNERGEINFVFPL